jgi:large subunit ribosomal protein L2
LLNIFQNKFVKTFLGLIKYTNGSYSYVSLQHGCFVGQVFQSSYIPLRFFFFYSPGNLIPLKFISLQSIFSNIIVNKKNKSQYCKAAGTFCRIIKKYSDLNVITIKLPTKQKKHFIGDTFVTLGRNSNILNFYQIIGKAGVNRNNGIRPKVRGVAMNPVDHPHGGRTKSNKPEVSIWGWVTKKNH